MVAFIVEFLVGVICVVIGILNTKGNISLLHSYHTHRVTEENRIPFGKKIGLGTIIIGCSVILSGILSAMALIVKNNFYAILGEIVLTTGLIAGIVIIFYALFKYNKGIF